VPRSKHYFSMRTPSLPILFVSLSYLIALAPIELIFAQAAAPATKKGAATKKGPESKKGPEPKGEPTPKPVSLKSVKVPEPSKIGEFIQDKVAAIALGKALFWDMQVGSDGVTACATCHFQAGADNRIKNQISPGLLRVNSAKEGDSDTSFQVGGPNYTLKKEDFPFHKLSNINDRKSNVLSSVNDVASSQGVILEDFGGLTKPGQTEIRTVSPDNIFSIAGVNTRRVEPRNTPTVINAIFNLRNFWDGRAQDSFNGVNPFGRRDLSAYVWKADKPKDLKQVSIDLDMASLASQAVGPPLSNFEMSASGRLFPELGRKLLGRRPLSAQRVHRDDSVLGSMSLDPAKGINVQTYADLIKKAFRPQWWQGEVNLQADTAEPVAGTADTMGLPTLSKGQKKGKKPRAKLTQFTHMEANFSLYFGLAIQLYEATLVSDQTPFDSYAEGKSNSLNAQQKQGLDLFFGKAKCTACHGGAEFTKATVGHIKNERLERMIMGDGKEAIYDNGFYNIGVRPTLEDLGVGGTDPFGLPLSESRLAKEKGEKVFKEAIGVHPNIKVNPNERIAADGAFKTPTLRNIELTAPYFHNGGQRTLREVVDFYNRGGDFHEQNIADLDPDITNLNLSDVEKEALVAFMKSLTDERVRYRRAPFDHPQLMVPNGHVGDQSKVTNDGSGRAGDLFIEIPPTGRSGATPLPAFLE
jgi:cytochrome c peroxidase